MKQESPIDRRGRFLNPSTCLDLSSHDSRDENVSVISNDDYNETCSGDRFEDFNEGNARIVFLF